MLSHSNGENALPLSSYGEGQQRNSTAHSQLCCFTWWLDSNSQTAQPRFSTLCSWVIFRVVGLQDGLLLDTETFYTIAQQEILAGLGKVGSSSLKRKPVV
jgi:hypothetical protein